MKRPARRVRTRVVLPPNGSLHLGSARIALLNWLLAKRQGGEVLLRGNDGGDAGRNGVAEQDLEWLGLPCTVPSHDRDTQTRYRDAAEALKRAGRLYPCLESDEELRAKQDWRVRRGKSPVYDRAMLKLTAAQLASAEAGGKRPYWRFRLSDRVLAWDDLVLGRTEVKLPTLSDPVVVAADGTVLPTFATVVDDIDDGITHVLQGEDHVSRTGIQLDLRAALGADPSALHHAHVPQLQQTAANGRAARFEGLTLRRLRGDGIEPAAIAAYLAALGTAAPAVPASPADLAATFDLASCARTEPRFDIAALQTLNGRVLAAANFADVSARLPAGATETFWLAIRGHIELLAEASGWWDVAQGTIVPPVIEGEAGFLRTALALLPPEPWGPGIWAAWSAALREATGRDVAAQHALLLLALTGEDHGPSLTALLPLIGRSRTAERLQLAAA